MDYKTKAINCVKDTVLPAQMKMFKECNYDMDICFGKHDAGKAHRSGNHRNGFERR